MPEKPVELTNASFCDPKPAISQHSTFYAIVNIIGVFLSHHCLAWLLAQVIQSSSYLAKTVERLGTSAILSHGARGEFMPIFLVFPMPSSVLALMWQQLALVAF